MVGWLVGVGGTAVGVLVAVGTVVGSGVAVSVAVGVLVAVGDPGDSGVAVLVTSDVPPTVGVAVTVPLVGVVAPVPVLVGAGVCDAWVVVVGVGQAVVAGVDDPVAVGDVVVAVGKVVAVVVGVWVAGIVCKTAIWSA